MKPFIDILISPSNRPNDVGTVTFEERENFAQIKKRLRILMEHQLTNFRFVYPFGRPEGALKATLSLMEQVECISPLKSLA